MHLDDDDDDADVIVYQLHAGLSREVVTLLLCLAASIFTIVGGVGGGLYTAYFATTGVLGIVLFYFIHAFFLRWGGSHHAWGFAYDSRQVSDMVCDIVKCGKTHSAAGNLEHSPLTFSSLDGLLKGVGLHLGTSL